MSKGENGRVRCPWCNQLRGLRMAAWRSANWEKYAPFCSYQCKQYMDLSDAQNYLRKLRED